MKFIKKHRRLKITWIFLKTSFAFIVTTGKAIYKMIQAMRDSWKFVKYTKKYQKEQKERKP